MSLLFSWTGSTICSIVLCIIIIFVMKKDVHEDSKNELSSEWYVAVFVVSCIPVINYIIMFAGIAATILCTILNCLLYLANKFRGKVRQKQISDIEKYNTLKKLLVSTSIFKDESHIEDFIQSGDVMIKLSEKI